MNPPVDTKVVKPCLRTTRDPALGQRGRKCAVARTVDRHFCTALFRVQSYRSVTVLSNVLVLVVEDSATVLTSNISFFYSMRSITHSRSHYMLNSPSVDYVNLIPGQFAPIFEIPRWPQPLTVTGSRVRSHAYIFEKNDGQAFARRTYLKSQRDYWIGPSEDKIRSAQKNRFGALEP